MENLKEKTPTELLKLINDTTAEHEKVKQEIINYTYELEELEKKINEKIEYLNNLEKDYVQLIEEISNKLHAV